MNKYTKRQLTYMSVNKRVSPAPSMTDYLTDEEIERKYREIEGLKKRKKKESKVVEEANGGNDEDSMVNNRNIKIKANEPERKRKADSLDLNDSIDEGMSKRQKCKKVFCDDSDGGITDGSNIDGTSEKEYFDKVRNSSITPSLETPKYTDESEKFTDGKNSQRSQLSGYKNSNLTIENDEKLLKIMVEMKEEIKEIKKNIRNFRNMETLLNMMAEMKKELGTIKQIKKNVKSQNHEVYHSKWNMIMDGKIVPLHNVGIDDKMKALVNYRKNFIDDGKLKLQGFELLDKSVTKSIVGLMEKPQVFGRYLMDNLFTKKQLMEYKFSVGFNRTSKRKALPTEVKKELMALLKYGGVGLIEEEQRWDYLTDLFEGINTRSSNWMLNRGDHYYRSDGVDIAYYENDGRLQ
uniref:ARID domain-containing protein n=1 Tax=Strongyloides stercoralis TaxID=6248 RepID=A0A0K0EA85_STRER